MNINETITDQIIENLKNEVVPWKKPWSSSGIGSPINGLSGKPYRGINVFILTLNDYPTPVWLTFKQAKILGGKIKKGEKATPICFWKWSEKQTDNGESERYSFLKHYNVFNISQCEVELPKKIKGLMESKPFNKVESLFKADNLINKFVGKPVINHIKQNKAFYSPTIDSITLPIKNQFDSQAEYYSTLFHELGHSTGHSKRLNRPGIEEIASFGSNDYSKEELIAEMTAAFLCGYCQIDNTIENSTAYIKSWLTVLKDDNKMVISAASAAQKAFDHILGVKF